MNIEALKSWAESIWAGLIAIFTHSRMKSLYWRAAGMMASGFLDTVGEQSAMWNLPPEMVIFLGLAIGEVTKFLNNKVQSQTELK